MEDSPVSLQGSYYIESFFFCVLWTKCFFSHLSSYIYFLQSHIFLLNCDVCCSFPLPKMLEAHRGYGGIGTLLVIKVCDCIWLVWFLFFWRVNQICFCVLVFRSLLNQPANLENWLQIQLLMSCFITPRNPKLLYVHLLLRWPNLYSIFKLWFLCFILETQVSDRINCGVYVFTPEIFNAIGDVSTQRKDRGKAVTKILHIICVFLS
jgi:hypothetical protein